MAATTDTEVTLGDLQDYAFIKLEEKDSDDFLDGTKKLTLVDMVGFIPGYWADLETFVEDIDILIAKIHRILYMYFYGVNEFKYL